MSYKLILVNANSCECYDRGYDDNCCCEPDMRVQEINSMDDLIALSKGNFDLKRDINSLAIKTLEDSDENLNKSLKEKGWVNLKEIKDREEKLKAEKRYYYSDTRYARDLQEVDLENLTDHVIRELANDNVKIVQSIGKTSLKKTFDARQKKVYTDELASLKRAKDRKSAAKKKRQEDKLRKEVEKAKRILANAGIE